MLVQGSTLTTAARRLGVALKQTTHAVSRVEIDIPGQTEQEIVGYPVTADSVILGLSRLPAWARVLMVVRKGHILDAPRGRGAPAGRLLLLPGRPRPAAAPRQPVPREPRRRAAARAALRRAADPRRDPGRRGRAVLRPRLRPARARDHPRRVGGGAARRPAGARRRARRFPAASWWCAGSNPGASPAWACSSTSCCRSSPTSSCSRGSRPRPTSSAASAAGCARLTRQPSRRPRT